MGAYLHETLRAAISDHPLVGDVRGFGLIGGIELVKDKTSKEQFPMPMRVGRQLYKILFELGMVSRVLGDTLVFAPALTINKEQADRIVTTFAKGLDLLVKKL
jgi:L-2,4-diaminobutyrate transaminase